MNTKIFYGLAGMASILAMYMGYSLEHSSLATKTTLQTTELKTLYQHMRANHNPNIPLKTLLKFVDYPDCEVRRDIISYPNISENVLNEMSKLDPDVGVRHVAKRRLDFLHGISHLEAEKYKPKEENAEIKGLIKLANNCAISDGLAHNIYGKSKKINGYPRTLILMALAVNPQTPPDILNELAVEKDLRILRKLAENPNLPSFLVQKFFPYPDCKIRKKILCHPNLTTFSIHKLQHDYDLSVVNEATQRLQDESAYLAACKETVKTNASCQTFYETTTPNVRFYPNISKSGTTGQLPYSV